MYSYKVTYRTPMGYRFCTFFADGDEETMSYLWRRRSRELTEVFLVEKSPAAEQCRGDGAHEGDDCSPCGGPDGGECCLPEEVVAERGNPEHDGVGDARLRSGGRGGHARGDLDPVRTEDHLVSSVCERDEASLVELVEHLDLDEHPVEPHVGEPLDEVPGLVVMAPDPEEVPGEVCGDSLHACGSVLRRVAFLSSDSIPLVRNALSWGLALAIIVGTIGAICPLAVGAYSLAVAFPSVTLAVMVLVGAASVATLLWVVVTGVCDWAAERL